MEGTTEEVDFSEIYSMERIAYNARSLNFCRVFVAIISGIASGVLGLEGIPGFLAFFLTTFLLSVAFFPRTARWMAQIENIWLTYSTPSGRAQRLSST